MPVRSQAFLMLYSLDLLAWSSFWVVRTDPGPEPGRTSKAVVDTQVVDIRSYRDRQHVPCGVRGV